MLGTMKMTRLVPQISVPIMISMLVQALYNVVDSIFVSRWDTRGLTAVSLAYPVQMLMPALAVGMGVGINSLISRKLGEHDPEAARRAGWNGVFIEVCGFVLFFIVGCFSGPLMNLLVSDNLSDAAYIRELGTTYLSIVTMASIGAFMAICFERMLQSTGNTVASMITQLCGAVANMILDPIMIFGMFGLPEMGVAGAAWATILGQLISMTVGFVLNQTRNPELKLRLKEFALDKRSLKGIITVGLPSTVMQAISSVMNVGMNGILSGFAEVGNDAVNVLNIYFKLQSFIFMPVFGLGNGMVAIIGYNFGARLKERVYEAVKVALVYAACIMLFGTLLFQLLPEQLMSLFESEESAQMTAIGVTALRTISWHFIIAAVGVTLSNVFQAVGKGSYSLIVSLCRQLVVLLPAAWLLSRVSLEAVWWSFCVAEVISLALCLLFYRRCDRKMLSKL